MVCDRTNKPLLPATLVALAVLWPCSLSAAELKKETLEAYDRYIALIEQRTERGLSAPGAFLWPDLQPAATRSEFYDEVKRGQVLTEQLDTPDGHTEVDVPDGMINDWRGLVFVPGATLDQTLAVVQNYNRDVQYYAPVIAQSKVLEHTNDSYRVFYRMNKKTIVNVVFEAIFEIHYQRLGPDRVISRSRAARIMQIKNPGKQDEHALPPGHGSGYMWRLHSYWRFQERDGGTYIELESVALSRQIPWLFRWVIGPLVTSIARETITSLLIDTRDAVLKYGARPAQKDATKAK